MIMGSLAIVQIFTTRTQHEFSMLMSLGRFKIVDIDAGDNFSAALDDQGRVFTWGYGNDGQLGHGNKSDLACPK